MLSGMKTTLALRPNHEMPATPIMALSEAVRTLAHLYWLRVVMDQFSRAKSKLSGTLAGIGAPPYLGLSPEQFKELDAAGIAQCACSEAARINDQAQLAQTLLRERVAALCARMNLDTTSADFLVFAALTTRDKGLRALCHRVPADLEEDASEMIASVLDADPVAISELLTASSPLVASSLLLAPDSPADNGLRDYVRMPKYVYAGLFATEAFEAYLLRHTFSLANAPLCAMTDYAHLQEDLPLLRAALTGSRGAAHVLLVGGPGVGKTQLARCIAHNLGWTAWEVRTDDSGRNPAQRSDRFQHYALGCRLLSGADRTLVIFDEAEDVFTGDHWTHVNPSCGREKGWTNRLLETVTVPTIWISNSLHHIDPAYVRRFDYVLKMRTPPRSVRHRLLAEAVRGSDASPALLDRIVDSERFTPADADRVARVLPQAIAQGVAADSALERLAACRPGGVARNRLRPPRAAAMPYRIEWINVAIDAAHLIEGLRVRSAGTLLFSGAPGTGKTEFARHIARRLDRPLLIKRASDLLSPFVGRTEKLIAEAFEDAERDEAVLLIDEVDSFLRDRRGAEHEWQITQVNELLAQLDDYRGIAIFTTNFSDALDRAALRRMDVKLTFGSLRPEHVWEAFHVALETLGVAAPDHDALLAQRVRGLRELTPGDFSAALRGLHLGGAATTAESLLNALLEELRHKHGTTTRAIGFGA